MIRRSYDLRQTAFSHRLLLCLPLSPNLTLFLRIRLSSMPCSPPIQDFGADGLQRCCAAGRICGFALARDGGPLILLVRFAKCFQPGAKRPPKMSHRDYLLPCATVQFYSPECTCFRQLIPPHAANTTTGIQGNTRNSHDHNQHGDLALCCKPPTGPRPDYHM